MFDFSIEFAMEAFIIVLLGVAISMFVAFITNIDKELALHDKTLTRNWLCTIKKVLLKTRPCQKNTLLYQVHCPEDMQHFRKSFHRFQEI